MATILIASRFYEFHKERIISRPGAILATAPGMEIGPEISREQALRLVKAGHDVCTMRAQDARQPPGAPIQARQRKSTPTTRAGRHEAAAKTFTTGTSTPVACTPVTVRLHRGTSSSASAGSNTGKIHESR